MRRRALLASLPTAVATTGCSGNGSDATDVPTSDENDDEADDDEPSTNGNEIVSVESVQLGTNLRRRETPWWYEYDEEAPGAVYLIDDSDTPDHVPRVEPPDDREDEGRAFVDETDFETAVLLQIGSVGPNACYDQLDVGDFELTEKTLRGTAEVVESQKADGCPDEITYPWILVRVETADTLPEHARITITDGTGNQREVEAPKRRRLDPDTLDGSVQPDRDPPQIPAELACPDEEFDRHGSWTEDVTLGEAFDLGGPIAALRTDQDTYEYGETVHIRFRNLTDRGILTGNASHFNFQLNTEAGWEDVRGFDEDEFVVYSDVAIIHPPGKGFDWSIELTEAGIGDEGLHADALRVCPELQEGRYRFVFWEVDVAVEFDLLLDG